MPEVYFSVTLPGGETKECYSPSTVVREYFREGEEMTLETFVKRSREALARASERVRECYGFSCASAMGQLEQIEEWSREYPSSVPVRVSGIGGAEIREEPPKESVL